MRDSRKHNYDDTYYRDKETSLHVRDSDNGQREPVKTIDKLTPTLSLAFVIAVQLVGSVWWAATLDSRVEHVSEQVKTLLSDNYSNSQAQSDKLNTQLQIDQHVQDRARLEKEIEDLQNKLEKLYDRVYSR